MPSVNYLRWPLSEPPSEKRLRVFYDRITVSFHRLFVEMHCQNEIRQMIDAIETNQPILEIAQSSFSTIFLPFHSGTFDFLSLWPYLTVELMNFFELSGRIESLTDTYPTYENEPTLEEKQQLLPLLEEFLRILPDMKTFISWQAFSQWNTEESNLHSQ